MTKEEIIAEIQRIAKENGGKPPGVDRFEGITGIRPYDWQKYWLKFTDAQFEAGFKPNQMVGSLGDDFKFEKLAQLMRDIGKFPTRVELRHRKLADPDFPSASTIEHMGGNKQEVIIKFLNWCRDKPEYADVVKLLEGIKIETATEYVSDEGVKCGFVYLVRGHPGEYKIGRTNLVDRRLSELGATASIEQELVHAVKTDDPAGIETYWHRRFQDKRMKGEWFKLNSSDVRAFRRWRKIF